MFLRGRKDGLDLKTILESDFKLLVNIILEDTLYRRERDHWLMILVLTVVCYDLRNFWRYDYNCLSNMLKVFDFAQKI